MKTALLEKEEIPNKNKKAYLSWKKKKLSQGKSPGK